MTNIAMPAGPIDAQKRLILLDGLRGFALLGILFANMTNFSGWFFMSAEQRAAISIGPSDGVIDYLFELLVHGKFYALFSLMFGIGFALQLQRIEEKGEGTGRYARRLFFLMLFGLSHILLLWIGDILLLYALMGFVLLLMRGLSNRGLVIGAIILWMVPVVWAWWMMATGFNTFRTLMPLIAPVAQALEVPFGPGGPTAIWASPDLWMQTKSHVIDLYLRFVVYIDEMRFPKVLAMFLIGYWIGRKGIHREIASHVGLLKKVAAWGLLIGLPISALKAAMILGWIGNEWEYGRVIYALTYSLSVPLLALAYAAIAALAWNSEKEGFFRMFAPLGRMALTNYIMQTVIMSIIFFGWGFGLIDNWPLTYNVPLVAIIFISQLWFSRWWLARYKFGPLEWLWRSLTYGKAQPMRLAAG